MDDALSLAIEHVNRADDLLTKVRRFAKENNCFQKEIENVQKEEKEKKISEEEALKKVFSEKLNLHGFTVRIRNLPSLMLEAGVVPALTFYLSKVEMRDTLLKDLYKYFSGKIGLNELDNYLDKCKENKLLEEVGSKESAGYSLAMAVILSAMNNLLGINFDENDFLKSVAENLKSLWKDADKRFELELKLSIYAEELKKLVEAFSSAKWEVKEEVRL